MVSLSPNFNNPNLKSNFHFELDNTLAHLSIKKWHMLACVLLS